MALFTFTTFEGKLDRYLKWRVITECLPENRAAMQESGKNPELALKLINFESNHAHGAHGFGRVFSPKELRELFESNGIRVMRIYGDFVYSLPEEMRKLTSWEERLYAQVTDVIVRLSKEPSITGLGSELILVGEK